MSLPGVVIGVVAAVSGVVLPLVDDCSDLVLLEGETAAAGGGGALIGMAADNGLRGGGMIGIAADPGLGVLLGGLRIVIGRLIGFSNSGLLSA